MAVMCLRSTRFMDPMTRDHPVFLDLRRIHNIQAARGEKNAKQFIVTKRMPGLAPVPSKTLKWAFGTKAEAKHQWVYEAMMLEDKGMEKLDFLIKGFHEED